jgi:transcription elongation GreA/GreB family factor
VNRLLEELRREQDNYKSAESVRKQLEIEIREISVRLEEAESFAQREGKRLVAKLQSRVSCICLLIRVTIQIGKSNSVDRLLF